MKKAVLVLLMVLVAAVVFAETQTITLVSRVEKVDAKYAIRNAETGKIDASVIYSTEEIAKTDVRTSFDIIQINDSNSFESVLLQVSATELTARVAGKTYSTNGVSIEMNGVQYGSEVSFVRFVAGASAAGTVVGSFDVAWPTNSDLVDATYQACVTLTATAL